MEDKFVGYPEYTKCAPRGNNKSLFKEAMFNPKRFKKLEEAPRICGIIGMDMQLTRKVFVNALIKFSRKPIVLSCFS